MPQVSMQKIFLESASEVLETMFFTGVAEENTEQEGDSPISAELTFHGKPSGRFGVRMPSATGRLIAASFLGLDESEVAEQQVTDVVGELTNMFCGSVLSRIEAGARFELMHPEIDSANRNWRTLPNTVGYTFAIEEGTVTLWMALEENQPALVA